MLTHRRFRFLTRLKTQAMTEQSDREIFARGTKSVRPRVAESGELCSACSNSIEAGEVEYEVTVQTDLRSSVLRFHTRCYAIWSGEVVD